MVERGDKRRGRPLSTVLSLEADLAMREMVAGPKRIGAFLSSLLLQEQVRQETRAQCQAELRALYEGAGSGVDTID